MKQLPAISMSVPLYSKRSLVITGALLIIPVCNSLFAQVKRMPQKELVGKEAQAIVPGAQMVKEGNKNAYPSFIRLLPNTNVAATDVRSWLKKSLNMKITEDFKLIKTNTDTKGMLHTRFKQTYLGIPIDNAEYIAHSRNNKLVSVNGHAVNVSQQFNAKPALSEKQALQAGLAKDDASTYKWELPAFEKDLKARKKDLNVTYYPKGELVWLASKDNANLTLVYKFDVQAASPDKFFRMYVDAQTGAIVKTLPLESNCDAASVNTIFNGSQNISTEKYTGTEWRLKDDCKTADFRIRDWNSANCTNAAVEIDNTTNTWNNNLNERFGGTVLWLCNEAYDYWKTTFTLNSYDNSNGDIEGYINAIFDGSSDAGCQASQNNASMSFTGGTLKVGSSSSNTAGTLDNCYATVDIIGHEWAHAVTGAFSGLDYQDESGALNESFSDIFGECNELFTFGSHDWLMGSERAGGAIRSLLNPNAFNDPDTYLGTNWAFGTGDNGGVHTNSGVQNFWFYLLSTGGSGTNDNGDAYNVSGIGIPAASFIAAQNVINYLTNSSDYSDARTNSIQAAIDFYGACSNVVKQVTNAWYAVGVGNEYFDADVEITSDYNGRDVSCFDVCDATATVNVTSGLAPTYNWSTGSTTANETNICPGNHSVTVTNLAGLGCDVTVNFTVANTPLLTNNATVTSNYNGYGVSCNGEDDGTAAANASGGTTAYSYMWSDGQTTATATGLTAGGYSVTITDANGCTSIGNVTVTEPPALTATALPTSNYNGYNVRCHGGADGVAEAYPSGGVAPYTYLWSDGQTTKVATGLMAQAYSVTITDKNGCTTMATTPTLTEPPPLTIDAGENKIVYLGYPDSACTDLTYSNLGGGVPPYTVTWSTGSMSNTINVCPEVSTVYYVTVVDLNGCSLTDSVRVCVIDVRCGNNMDKVILCHNTGSASNPTQTLCVALPGAKNHIAHGDQLAACGTVKVCDFEVAPLIGKTKMTEIMAADKIASLLAYPNPFTTVTKVRFSLPESGTANLRMMDATGKQVSTLFNGRMEANEVKQVDLNAGSYGSGMYFLRLSTEKGHTQMLKIILVK